jgi:hypothetical protein
LAGLEVQRLSESSKQWTLQLAGQQQSNATLPMWLIMKLFTFGWRRLRAAATHDRSSVWASLAAAQPSAQEVRP